MLVAVGSPDRRVVVATDSARRIPAAVHRAVHVATDPWRVDVLGQWWTGQELDGIELEVLEDRGGVAATIAAEARDVLAQGNAEVLVVVGQLVARGGGRRLLRHRNTAESICTAIDRIPGAACLLVIVPADR